MDDRKVVHDIHNLGDLSLAQIENDIEHLMFVENDDLFPMSEYTKLQPVIIDLAKLVVIHADSAAKKMQDYVLFSVAKHLKDEVGNVVYRGKIPTTETLTLTKSEVEPQHDW